MRLIVIGALVVAALAIALLFEVMGHSEPATTAPEAPAHATTAAPPALATPDPPAPGAKEHARAMPTTHATAAPALPTSSADVAADVAAKPKHIDTPTDILRWSLMRAVRNSEPAVIDCLDKAKAAGTKIDGRAVFAFFVTTKNARAVISRASVDTSPYPDALNTCIVGALASGELDQELPEG